MLSTDDVTALLLQSDPAVAQAQRRTRDQRRYDERREALGLPLRNTIYIDRLMSPSTWTVYSMLRGGRIVLRAINTLDETTVRWQAVARYAALRNLGQRRLKYGPRQG